jgi:hypothetical protein
VKVSVPADAVAHIYEHLAEAAREMMSRNLRAEVTRSSECSFTDVEDKE